MRLENLPDWVSGNRLKIPYFDLVVPRMVVDGTVTLGGDDCLADKLVEIGSTVAIADSIALETLNVPKPGCQDYTPVDVEDVEGIPFDPETAVGTRLVVLAHDQDAAYTVGE